MSVELKARTKMFALDVLCLCVALPSRPEIVLIRGQLQRCATSVGANYRAACRGRSKAEFVAKLGIVEEEADESAFWMEPIIEIPLLKNNREQPLHDEAEAIRKIMAKSRITAGRSLLATRQSAIGNRQ